MLNPLQDKEFLKQLDKIKNKIIYIKIISLDQDGKSLETIEGRATSGSVNVDGASAVRRSCSLSFVALEGKNELSQEEIDELVPITNSYWGFKHKFELQIGIENNINSNYPPIIWFKQGHYIINNFSKSYNTNSLSISISGQDKMALLNGTLGGHFTHEVDFGVEEMVDVYGNVTTTKVPIYTIIKNALQVYAKEPLQNIIINDLDEYGWELWEYRGKEPIYYLYELPGESEQYGQVLAYIDDPNTIVKAYGELPVTGENEYVEGETNTSTQATESSITKITKDWYDCKISKLPQYYSLNSLDKEYNLNATKVKMNNEEEKDYVVIKIEYGETAGYHQISLVYNSDLILKAGEAITSLLDKIKNMLGNFEYFYDLNGRFVFQKKKNYLQELFSPINGDIVNPIIMVSPYEYKFDDLEMFTTVSDAPKIDNVKNDFTVWGQKRNGTNTIPFHTRYAIHKKPKYYKTQEYYEKRDLTYLEVTEYSTGKPYIQSGQNYKLLTSGEEYEDVSKYEIRFGNFANGEFFKKYVPDPFPTDGSVGKVIYKINTNDIPYINEEGKSVNKKYIAKTIPKQKYQIKVDFNLWYLTNKSDTLDENGNVTEYGYSIGDKRPYIDYIKDISLYGIITKGEGTTQTTEKIKLCSLDFDIQLSKIETDKEAKKSVLKSITYYEATQPYSDFEVQMTIKDYKKPSDNIYWDRIFWGGMTLSWHPAKQKYSIIETTNEPDYLPYLYYYKNNQYNYVTEVEKYYKKDTSSYPILYKKEKATEPEEYYWHHDSQTYISENYSEIIKEAKITDWRELIYQMAIDYYRHNTDSNFLYNVEEYNKLEGKTLYPNGITGYEQYYSDIQAFWRLLYNPEAAAADYGSLTYEFYDENANESYRYWNKAIHNDPSILPFWFDFLDLGEAEIDKYSVENIGQRTKVVNDTSINSIYYKEVPEVQFVILPKEKINKDSNNSYQILQIQDNMESMFTRSAQGLSAIEKTNDLIYQHSYCTESLSLSSIPIWYLNPNTRIYIEGQGDFTLDKISYNLNYNGTMGLTCTKIAKQAF